MWWQISVRTTVATVCRAARAIVVTRMLPAPESAVPVPVVDHNGQVHDVWL